jgi:hypothetical protein
MGEGCENLAPLFLKAKQDSPGQNVFVEVEDFYLTERTGFSQSTLRRLKERESVFLG